MNNPFNKRYFTQKKSLSPFLGATVLLMVTGQELVVMTREERKMSKNIFTCFKSQSRNLWLSLTLLDCFEKLIHASTRVQHTYLLILISDSPPSIASLWYQTFQKVCISPFLDPFGETRVCIMQYASIWAEVWSGLPPVTNFVVRRKIWLLFQSQKFLLAQKL